MKYTVASILFAAVSAKAMVGTNIGGWQVLEPWITPSLFYRFLGKTQSEGVGMDSWSLCEALGPEEGNRVMRAHWDAWVTEDHIKGLSEREVEIVRLPIGDWTVKPYGPYVGCMDGAAEKIMWFMDTCAKYNIKVLLDIHAQKGSQNGFDNSGQTSNLTWTDENNFSHWPGNAGNWMGPFNLSKWAYDYIYTDEDKGIQWSLEVVSKMMALYGQHPALYAFEPVNEPWWGSDYEVLKSFYRQARTIIRDVNPNVIFTFHDGFDFSASRWNDLFADDDMENVVIDTHFY
jgi:glucan 1,3-beta-glucosidase